MAYLITFLEGILSFLSPCMLPLLPVYLTYFAGNADQEENGGKLARIFAFVIGFTLSFLVLGLLFSVLGTLLARYQLVVNLVCGALMVAFGLHYLNVFRLPFWNGSSNGMKVYNVVSAFLFGVIYPVHLTPCVGAFLGSALALATTTGSVGQGTLLLLLYSVGLGVPFLLSALLMSQLGAVFAAVKRHYDVINRISGGLLILVGILMATGLLSRWMERFAT